MTSIYRGRAETITIEPDEDGFELHITTDSGARYTFNIHPVSYDLLTAARDILEPYWREAVAASYRCDPDESGGYDVTDPKHPTYHDRMSALADNR